MLFREDVTNAFRQARQDLAETKDIFMMLAVIQAPLQALQTDPYYITVACEW